MGKDILNSLRSDLLEKPVAIGTADHLADMTSQEFHSKAVPIDAGQLASTVQALLSTTQLQPIQPLQATDRTLSQEEMQTTTAKRPSADETGQKTKPSSRNETPHSVDIKA